jgi:hypothetical protein
VVGVLVLTAGCTSLLGLDATTSDRDHDGVVDSRDDCPNDYDPTQLDADADGFGDACGPCRIVTHDLDGDGRDDACDGCVGPGAVGADVDLDGVDDGCDPCVGGVGQTGMDVDHDGVDDGCDTCIASGIDRDHDQLDDACDACLLGPPHDEDGDGIDDGCDDCPADFDPDQTRTHGDDVGDACDPDPTRDDVHLVFDPFIAPLDYVWDPRSAWTEHGDDLFPVDDLPHRSYFHPGDDFVARTRVHFAPGAAPTDTLAIDFWGLDDDAIVFPIRHVDLICAVTASGVVAANSVGAPNGVDASAGVELRATRVLTQDSTGKRHTRLQCDAFDGAGGHAVAIDGSVNTSYPELRLSASSPTGWFDWVDVIAYDDPTIF